MKIGVVGLWHLGLVTAAGLASRDFSVVAYDPDKNTIALLKKNQSPISEPQLSELIVSGQEAEKLTFTDNPQLLTQCDMIWVTFDTPVDDQDNADSQWVIDQIHFILPQIKENAVILISSQLPIGSSREIKKYCNTHFPMKNFHIAYAPENLRLGKAIEIFLDQDRIIAGCEDDQAKVILSSVFNALTKNIIWMSVESAEMTKHALNAFLANSIVFINEIATLCEQTGADAREVEKGLKSESRIGLKAYLKAGAAIAGGTLLRDVTYVNQLAKKNCLTLPLFEALLESNQAHKEWAVNKLNCVLKDLKNKKIVVMGLSYKLGTDTLRRSISVELAQKLKNAGAHIHAYDPDISYLPEELGKIITLEKEFCASLCNADGLLIMKNLADFSVLGNLELINDISQCVIVDPNGFIQHNFSDHSNNHYYTMGK